MEIHAEAGSKYAAFPSQLSVQGIDLSLLNVAGGGAEYNPAVPAPSRDYSSKAARCWQGPCLNLCCNTDAGGVCIDNLVAGGGHYNPGVASSCCIPCTGMQACSLLCFTAS